MTRTRVLTSPSTGTGSVTSIFKSCCALRSSGLRCASVRDTRSKFSLSCSKSSSFGMDLAHSRMTGEKSKSGSRRFITSPMVCRFSRSCSNRLPTLSCWILTTTCWPPLSTALCTCAMDAHAMGCSSKDSKSSEMGFPNSLSTSGFTCENGREGSESWHLLRTSTYFPGMTSALLDRNCPSLTQSPSSDTNCEYRKSAFRKWAASHSSSERSSCSSVIWLVRHCRIL
mmetsp:Transcript_43189/g.69346  ORF Transcript_43189/g.69346 Transcript_43189/m.69346 type:complete len:227 (-) Transcript_43189:434-1114(-)